MKKRLLVLLCVLGSGQLVCAQKILYLKPVIGRQTPVCRFDKSIPNEKGLIEPLWRMNWSYGALLALKLNDDWTIQTGLENGFTGWHFRRSSESTAIANNVEGYWAFHQTHRLELLVQRRLLTVMALNLDPEKELYLLNFDLYATAGVSYNLIPKRGAGTDSTILGTYPDNNPPESDHSYYRFLRTRSGAIYVGIGTQFYHQNNPRFDFTLFYSQGLSDVLAVEIINNRQGNLRTVAKLRTRGSVIGATLAYPIRLKTFERKRV